MATCGPGSANGRGAARRALRDRAASCAGRTATARSRRARCCGGRAAADTACSRPTACGCAARAPDAPVQFPAPLELAVPPPLDAAPPVLALAPAEAPAALAEAPALAPAEAPRRLRRRHLHRQRLRLLPRLPLHPRRSPKQASPASTLQAPRLKQTITPNAAIRVHSIAPPCRSNEAPLSTPCWRDQCVNLVPYRASVAAKTQQRLERYPLFFARAPQQAG
jgi:hypothetical protein